MVFDFVVAGAWTLCSLVFVLLAIYGIIISGQEDKDTRAELSSQRNRPRPNGILVLALQQASQSKYLKRMHRLAFCHQGAGLLIGMLTLYRYVWGTPTPNVATTTIGKFSEYFNPLLFLFLLFCVCGVQLFLIKVTWEQRQARLDLRSLELEDEDEMRVLFARMAAQMTALHIQIQEGQGPETETGS